MTSAPYGPPKTPLADPFQPSDHRSDRRREQLADHEPLPLVFGTLEPLPAGYLICFFVLAEGVFVLANIAGPSAFERHIFVGLSDKNPFLGVQWAALWVLGIGDIVTSLAGAVGLKSLPSSYAWLAKPTQGALLAWRAAVTVITAPWVGFMLAFEPEGDNRTIPQLVTLLYLAINVYFLWCLVLVLQAAAEESRRVLDIIKQEDNDELRELLNDAYQAGYPDLARPVEPILEDYPVLFGCLPLEKTVALHALLLCTASIVWLIHLIETKQTIGGWAWLTPLPPDVTSTYALEILAYTFTFPFSVLALTAITFHNRLDGTPQDLKLLKGVSVALLAYFFVNVLRFTSFIPITGMAVAAQDVCGIYIRGLTDLALFKPWYSTGMPMHCRHGDWKVVAGVLMTILLDAYLIWGVLRLWRRYRAELQLGSEPMPVPSAQKLPGPSSLYGAADPRRQ